MTDHGRTIPNTGPNCPGPEARPGDDDRLYEIRRYLHGKANLDVVTIEAHHLEWLIMLAEEGLASR